MTLVISPPRGAAVAVARVDGGQPLAMPGIQIDLRDQSMLKYRCAVDPNALWLLRRLFEQWLGERNVSPVDAEDLVVVMNELCSSSVVHGTGEEIQLRAYLGDGDITIQVVGRPLSSPVAEDEVAVARLLSTHLTIDATEQYSMLTARSPFTLSDPMLTSAAPAAPAPGAAMGSLQARP